MSDISIGEFRATLKVSRGDMDVGGEEIYSYWNNQSADRTHFDLEEVLHITRKTDGSFYLEIGNLLHHGTLEELEEILFEWAQDEGWFT